MNRRFVARCAAGLAGIWVVIAGVLGASVPAYAHSQLVGAAPGPGQIVPSAPAAIELRFNEPVTLGPGPVRVLDTEGQRVDTGRAQPAGDGLLVRAPLRTSTSGGVALANGTYVVVWRATSLDGHPIQGAYTFSVGAPSISGTAGQALVDRYLAQSGASTTVGVLAAIGRMLAFLGMALLIGALVAATTWARRGVPPRAASSVIIGGGAIAAVGTVLVFLAQGSYSAGLGFTEMFRGDLLVDTMQTRVGTALIVRIALIAGVVAWWRWGRRAVPQRMAVAVMAVFVLALALSVSFAGHAATGPLPGIGVALDVMHFMLVSLWFGGLVMLAWGVLRTEPIEWSAAQRFSALALWCVIGIVLTGSAQGWRQLGSFSALTETAYGQALIVKVMIFACVLPLAAYARDYLRRRDNSAEPSDVVANGVDTDDGETNTETADTGGIAPSVVARKLRRSIAIEVVFLVGVFGASAVLVNTVPGREALAKPVFVQMVDAKVRIDGAIAPATLGPNDVHLLAFTPDGIPYDVNAMTARLERSDLGSLDIPLRRLTPGHYYAPQFVIPRQGTWNLIVTVDVDAFTRNTQQTKVLIR
ncbi:MAG: copper resistance CopC/CopD family protein [Acidimicrobiia bacterium]